MIVDLKRRDTRIIRFVSGDGEIEFNEEEEALAKVNKDPDYTCCWLFDLSGIRYIGVWVFSKVIFPLFRECDKQGGMVIVIGGEGSNRLLRALLRKSKVPSFWIMNYRKQDPSMN